LLPAGALDELERSYNSSKAPEAPFLATENILKMANAYVE
jgi:hypothetical protein